MKTYTHKPKSCPAKYLIYTYCVINLQSNLPLLVETIAPEFCYWLTLEAGDV